VGMCAARAVHAVLCACWSAPAPGQCWGWWFAVYVYIIAQRACEGPFVGCYSRRATRQQTGSGELTA
jgi:hypothetical protein